MLLCSCHAVSERTIRAAIASGAQTAEEIAERCGAGAKCGGCWPALYDLLGERSQADPTAQSARAHSAA